MSQCQHRALLLSDRNGTVDFGGYVNTGPGGVAFLWMHQAITKTVSDTAVGLCAKLGLALPGLPGLVSFQRSGVVLASRAAGTLTPEVWCRLFGPDQMQECPGYWASA